MTWVVAFFGSLFSFAAVAADHPYLVAGDLARACGDMKYTNELEAARAQVPSPEQVGRMMNGTFARGYMIGFPDGFVGKQFGICYPEKGAPADILCGLFTKLTGAHPERLSEPANVLLIDALRISFPCSAK